MQPICPSPHQSDMRPVRSSSHQPHPSVNCPHVELSFHHIDMSVCRTTCQSVCKSPRKSVALSVCTLASLSVIPIHQSYDHSVQHPNNSSMTCPSVTPPISPALHPLDCPSPCDHLYPILPCPSDHQSPPDHLYDKPISPSNHLSLPDHLYDKPPSSSACLSLSDSLTATMTCPTVHPSSHMIHHTQDSSQSLAVMNWEQSRNAKKFHRAFTNYDLLLRALDVSSIYLSDSRCVAPPKSGEAHVTCGRGTLGGTTLNKLRFGFSYMLPRLWDPG